MKPNITNEAVKYGIISGLLSLVIMYGAWAVSINTFVSVRFISSFIPYVIGILIFGGITLRKANDNLLSYSEALKFAFLGYVIVEIFFAIGSYVLFNFLDTNLSQKTLEIAMEQTQRILENMGASADDIEKGLERTKESGKDMSFKTVFLGAGLYLIWDFILSLLIALIIRREAKFQDQL